MGSVAIVFGVFCVAPMLLIAFGYWLGKGMPGSPIVIARREVLEQRSGGASRAASRVSLEHVE